TRIYLANNGFTGPAPTFVSTTIELCSLFQGNTFDCPVPASTLDACPAPGAEPDCSEPVDIDSGSGGGGVVVDSPTSILSTTGFVIAAVAIVFAIAAVTISCILTKRTRDLHRRIGSAAVRSHRSSSTGSSHMQLATRLRGSGAVRA